MSYKDVCVLIPTLNEEESIEPVIREFQALGYENILVVDGHSTDATVAKARAAGARIFLQLGSGKGQALKEVFAEIRKMKDLGMTVLLVEQNVTGTLQIADRAYVMETGEIILEGESADLLHNPEVKRAYLGKGAQEVWL